ncbi:putative exported protein [Mycobacterium lepraemurium]|nr:putative exported protein [Mycobacterium lepraemurium]
MLAPAAVFFAVSADVHPFSAREEAKPVISEPAPCCAEIVTLASTRLSKGFGDGQPVAASRYHTRSRFLPAGVAPERGLQVRTILTARSISAEFPQIHEIGGVRPDPLPWHPLGMAIDVMIPDPESAQGIALGNAIVAYVLQNADRFGIQDAIWRGVYYTPNGAQTSRLGHYDHVHVTTIGGGYPTGDEVYLR